MSLRFLADADLKYAIVTGTRLREPAIDFLSAVDANLEGVQDPDVLRIAARQGRILVSHDESTLPVHFANFLAERRQSLGVFIAPQDALIRDVIEALVLIWSTSEAHEWANRILRLPPLKWQYFRW